MPFAQQLLLNVPPFILGSIIIGVAVTYAIG